MSDPFRIEGPAVISFSGGRTSGYMLWRALRAHQGRLPDDVVTVFTNTGKEMGETLDFVQECSQRWNVPIVWLEYLDQDDAQKRWRVVTYDTASRNGEPYATNIRRKNLLPNPVTRFCTQELKIRPVKHYCQQALGWTEWAWAVGIRADEPRRVARLGNDKEAYTSFAPLAEAGIRVAEIGRFWSEHPFDLRLPNMGGKTMHGNCDLCFLKGANQIMSLIREQPQRAVWWMQQEQAVTKSERFQGAPATFRIDRPSYTEMHRMATSHDELFDFGDEPLQDCMCTEDQ